MIDLPDLMDRYDLSAFVSRARSLDETCVVRLRRRPDGAVGVWVRTPFDVLATRSVRIGLDDPDVVHDATALVTALRTPPPPRSPLDGPAGPARIDPGFSMPSAWEWGALPPDTGFVHVDDVPARTVVALSREGAEVARTESGPQGPPPSLLEQTVLDVTGGGDDGVVVGVPMRAVFAVTAMGFVTDADGRMVTGTTPVESIDPAEPVRVRATATWARLDARFGSVCFRRAASIPLTPI
ncbi:hypothetical protein [Williamsia deligens]|uniref:Uncharacterized protein n=1 Tax=Williamsia deligens TaxID=321325 RepID=A0ABW3GGW3_9NOCA|nr:hypothetical protein [Williamsia deligens]MCP2195605.1 hypothetical protein [Williamsia deligens]